MKTLTKNTGLLFVLALLATSSAIAQLRLGLQAGTLLDDNALNNYLQTEDRMVEVMLQGAYEMGNDLSNTRIFYNGSLNSFTLLPSRSYQAHEIGFMYSHLLEDEGESALHSAVSFSVRDNREEFTAYDHTQIELSGDFRSFLSPSLLLKGGYTFRSVRFPELVEFDYTEHALFINGALSPAARTTLILQADLGFKVYAGEPAGSVSQLAGSLRVGQGLSDLAGISLTAMYQMNLQKDPRYLVFEEGMLTDDLFFDDHYGYEGPAASLTFTQLLPAETRVRITGTVQRRLYTTRPALDMDGDEQASARIDVRPSLAISLEKTFPALGLSGTLLYEHIRNSSNDPFYTYRNNALSLRFSFEY